MKNILIITPYQFGYNTTIYNYTKYLLNYFDVTVICFFQNKEKFNLLSVKIIYLEYDYKFFSLLRLYFNSYRINKKVNFDFYFIQYFIFITPFSFFLKNKLINVYVNTSFIFQKNKVKEYIYNKFLKLECAFFINVSVISCGLGEFLGLFNFSVLPIGASPNKFFKTSNNNNNNIINILYVGTLYNRDIYKTIVGIRILLDFFPYIRVNYNIIGFGSQVDVLKIISTIFNYQLEDSVNYLGEIRPPLLNEFFSKADIGVSFIPCISEYNFQPATKTYEYLLSGLPVIATTTYENKKIINQRNGILINDNSHEFALAILSYYNNRSKFDKNIIFQESLHFSWENIVKQNLVPHINKILL